MFQPPVRRRIYLMRHAEAAYVDEQGNVAPDSRLVPLTSEGRRQAAEQAKALAEIDFDRAVCSGLPRTVETAGIVLGKRTRPDLEVVPSLEEIRPGDGYKFEGLDEQQQLEMLQDIANPWLGADQPGARFLQGELFEAFGQRILPAWDQLLADDSWRCLLLVLHGAVNRHILTHLLKAPPGTQGNLEQDNACINIIDVDSAPRERALVRLLNFTNYNHAKQDIHLTTMEHTAQRIGLQIKDGTR